MHEIILSGIVAAVTALVGGILQKLGVLPAPKPNAQPNAPLGPDGQTQPSPALPIPSTGRPLLDEIIRRGLDLLFKQQGGQALTASERADLDAARPHVRALVSQGDAPPIQSALKP